MPFYCVVEQHVAFFWALTDIMDDERGSAVTIGVISSEI